MVDLYQPQVSMSRWAHSCGEIRGAFRAHLSSLSKEWRIDGVHADGSTVTVLLHVFAGIDVQVTLDGRVPDQVNAPIPILEHVFQDVAPGRHDIEVRDVVGFSETVQVVVPTLTTTKSPTNGLSVFPQSRWRSPWETPGQSRGPSRSLEDFRPSCPWERPRCR